LEYSSSTIWVIFKKFESSGDGNKLPVRGCVSILAPHTLRRMVRVTKL